MSTLSHHIYHQIQAISTQSTQQPTVSHIIHRFLHFPIENPGFLREIAAQNFNLSTKSGSLDIRFRKKTIFGTRFYRKNDPIFDKNAKFLQFLAENYKFSKRIAAQISISTTKFGSLDIKFRKKAIFGTKFYRKHIFGKYVKFLQFLIENHRFSRRIAAQISNFLFEIEYSSFCLHKITIFDLHLGKFSNQNQNFLQKQSNFTAKVIKFAFYVNFLTAFEN